MVKIREYPEKDEYAICTVKAVKNYGAFASLDEYGEKTGYIALPEIATGWIKYVRDHIREGQKIVCKVLRVDQKREHIDLSLKQVSTHHRAATIREWKNEKRAEKLLELMAKRLGKSVQECYEEFGYRLIETYDSLYRAMEEYLVDEEDFQDNGFTGDWVKVFGEIASENIQPPYVKITGFVELACPGMDGLDVIKEALMKAEKGREMVEIQYKGAPVYRIKVKALEYKEAEAILREVADSAIGHVLDNGGTGKFKRTE
ncbi:MAG: translation initiation factor IF-2 subunit alpha [Thermoplasmata archaeon]|nr:translation initiation factor IF-2 subunit alpha [Thermoplasmata archaeon]